MVIAGPRITEITDEDNLDTAAVLGAIRRGTEQAVVNDVMDLDLKEIIPDRNINVSDNMAKLDNITENSDMEPEELDPTLAKVNMEDYNALDNTWIARINCCC